jgi:hypothetical protein
MKNIIFVAGLCLTLAQPVLASEPPKEPETVKVCVDVKDKDGKTVVDPKTKKPKQNCKEVKKHKKLEGAEKVPEGKKK